MDSERNKIDYANSLNSITNEYHEYHELNVSKYSNNAYNETTSFKEYNDNKTSLKAKKVSSGFTKLLSSAIVLTMAVVMGTSFIFGPRSKIDEVFIEGYDNYLFINITFLEYYEDDNLELVVKNDFTNRTFTIEAFEEGSEEEKVYMYFADVHDLKTNATYNISVVSGADTLYTKKYLLKEYEDYQSLTSINSIDASFVDELIMVAINFNEFDENDYVLIELEKDNVIYESIQVEQVMQNETYYSYSNSFSVTEDGTYSVNVYVNSNLEISKQVSVELGTQNNG